MVDGVLLPIWGKWTGATYSSLNEPTPLLFYSKTGKCMIDGMPLPGFAMPGSGLPVQEHSA